MRIIHGDNCEQAIPTATTLRQGDRFAAPGGGPFVVGIETPDPGRCELTLAAYPLGCRPDGEPRPDRLRSGDRFDVHLCPGEAWSLDLRGPANSPLEVTLAVHEVSTHSGVAGVAVELVRTAVPDRPLRVLHEHWQATVLPTPPPATGPFTLVLKNAAPRGRKPIRVVLSAVALPATLLPDSTHTLRGVLRLGALADPVPGVVVEAASPGHHRWLHDTAVTADDGSFELAVNPRREGVKLSAIVEIPRSPTTIAGREGDGRIRVAGPLWIPGETPEPVVFDMPVDTSQGQLLKAMLLGARALEWTDRRMAQQLPAPLLRFTMREFEFRAGGHYQEWPDTIVLDWAPGLDLDPWLVLHELGHFVHTRYFAVAGLGGRPDGSPDTPTRAFSEGFATWFSRHLVGGSWHPDPPVEAQRSGEISEHTVTALFARWADDTEGLGGLDSLLSAAQRLAKADRFDVGGVGPDLEDLLDVLPCGAPPERRQAIIDLFEEYGVPRESVTAACD